MTAAARLTAIRYAPLALDLELAPATFLPMRVRDVLSELVANPSAVADEVLQDLEPSSTVSPRMTRSTSWSATARSRSTTPCSFPE
jgi:hypothetical protein